MTTTTTDAAVQTYTIDASHSRMGFVARHLGFSKVRGSFGEFTGTIQLDPSDLSTLKTEGSAQTASITTGDEKRDGHLRSADFFEADAHPTLTFTSTGVENVQGNSFTLRGDLTMRGVTRPVAFQAEYLGEGADPWGGTRAAFEATTKVNRKEWGLNWNVALEAGGFLVSEEVEIVLEIQAVKG